MNSTDSKDSMDIGQHKRSFGTPTKMSISKFMVFPLVVVSRSAALPGTGCIYLCFIQGIAADSAHIGPCDVCHVWISEIGSGTIFSTIPTCDL